MSELEKPNNEVLEESFTSRSKPFTVDQKRMITFFMIIDLFHAFITISIGTITNAMIIAYNLSPSVNHSFTFLTILSCFIAFYPTSIIVTRFGIRWGLLGCLVFATAGACLCLMISTSFTLYLIGYFITQSGLQAIHSAKGYFVNKFFEEVDVKNSVNFIERQSFYFNYRNDSIWNFGSIYIIQIINKLKWST